VNSPRLLAAGSLAIGIALALALSSIADAILFRPLPVAHPEQIVRIYSASPLHSLGFVSYLDYQDFARARTLAGAAAQSQVLLAVGTHANDRAAEVRMGLAVTANYFDVLGVSAGWGRTFREEEEREAVVVLADAFWRGRWGGDRGILGRSITLAGTPFTVIGIAPPGFGLDRFLHEDFYVPIGVYAAGLLPSTGRPLEDRSRRFLSVYARRSAPLAAAQGDLAAMAAALSREFPATHRQQKAAVMTESAARAAAAGGMQKIAWLLLALAALTVAAALSNVSGLMLLESEARAGEYALKVALGASPLRLLGEALRRSAVLAALGTAAAVPLAWAALKAAARLWELPTSLPMRMDARIDLRIAVVAGGCALVATLFCALAPAAMARRVMSSRVTSSNTLRGVLVMLQVALAAGLLGSGASLFAGMRSASRIDLGYRTDHILTMTFDPSQMQRDETRTRAFYRELLERASRLPGVRAAAMAQSVPLGFTAAQKQVSFAAAGPDPMAVWSNTVTPEYIELMRMPVLAGRTFDARDTEKSLPVAVINQALAHFWPEGRALGQTIHIEGRAAEVIGIVQTALYQQVGEAPRPFLYLPYAQNFVPRMTLHIQTYGDPASVAPEIVEEARAVDPAPSASEIRALDDFLSHGALFAARVGVTVTGAAGACACGLSLTGLYACMASAAQRRRREIGIRRALGATRGSITRLLLAQAAKLTITGTGLGLGIAAGAQPGPGLLHPAALALTAGLVMAASLSACILPLWRAAGGDPAVALAVAE
jgi:predicted permease